MDAKITGRVRAIFFLRFAINRHRASVHTFRANFSLSRPKRPRTNPVRTTPGDRRPFPRHVGCARRGRSIRSLRYASRRFVHLLFLFPVRALTTDRPHTCPCEFQNGIVRQLDLFKTTDFEQRHLHYGNVQPNLPTYHTSTTYSSVSIPNGNTNVLRCAVCPDEYDANKTYIIIHRHSKTMNIISENICTYTEIKR